MLQRSSASLSEYASHAGSLGSCACALRRLWPFLGSSPTVLLARLWATPWQVMHSWGGPCAASLGAWAVAGLGLLRGGWPWPMYIRAASVISGL
eukprot:9012170-Alexandrium_andersonii.AAC.1